MCFPDPSGVFKVDQAAPGVVTRVTPDEGARNRHAALSPDGEWLAFLSGISRWDLDQPFPVIVLQDLTTQEHTVVQLDPPVSGIAFYGSAIWQNLEFSPDGTRLLFAADGDIYYADITALVAP